VGYSKQINYIIEKGSQFINDNPEIIRGIYKEISYNDEPKFYGYGIYFNDKYSNGDNEDAVAAGVSFDKEKALAKVLGETVERYSLSANNSEAFVFESFSKLNSLRNQALDPKSLIPFSHKESFTTGLDDKKLHWVQGKFLISGKKVLTPAQLVYVPYSYHNSEPLLRFSISTGAAAGMSLDDALYRGICEVVERDAFMIAYLNKISSPKIDLLSIKDKTIYDIVNMFKRYKLELFILDLTTDLQIPVFAAITLDRTGIGPAVSVGIKAGLNIKDAIIGAIEESLMVRTWIRDKFIYSEPNYKRGKEIITIDDRAHFWLPVNSIRYLNFWLKGKNFRKIEIKNPKYSQSNLRKATKLLKDRKIEVIYVDITDKKVKKYGFAVVKVIIPQLQPLYLDERYPYLGGTRLFQAPVKMKVLKKANTESHLNKIPHPFL